MPTKKRFARPGKKTATPVKARKRKGIGQSIQHHKKAIRDLVEQEIGKLEGRRIAAKKISDRKKIGKLISAKKKELRRLV